MALTAKEIAAVRGTSPRGLTTRLRELSRYGFTGWRWPTKEETEEAIDYGSVIDATCPRGTYAVTGVVLLVLGNGDLHVYALGNRGYTLASWAEGRWTIDIAGFLKGGV